MSKNLISIRNILHNYLGAVRFIEKISLEEDTIKISESDQAATLREVIINELYYSDNNTKIKQIWRVNLEQKIKGLSNNDSTPEIGLIILQECNDSESNKLLMLICLIELKSALKLKTLKDIVDKFGCAMNRLYMLLTLNNHNNEEMGYNGQEISIDFQGLVFYNESSIKIDDDEIIGKKRQNPENRLLSIFKIESKQGTLNLKTLFGEKDTIEVKFIENPNPHQHPNSISVNLQDLLKKDSN